MAKTLRKCPKCGSCSFGFVETTATSQTWTVVNGEFDEDDGILEPGSPHSTMAMAHGECHSCGHIWRFRGVLSWHDILATTESSA